MSLRSLEINKLINKPCPQGRSDEKKKINYQWGRCNKPTGFYTGNFVLNNKDVSVWMPVKNGLCLGPCHPGYLSEIRGA